MSYFVGKNIAMVATMERKHILIWKFGNNIYAALIPGKS
jgi:hypothetical protein